MIGDLDTPIYSDDEDLLRRAGGSPIAPPNATTPALKLRGLGPVAAPAPAAAAAPTGTTADLENRGFASHTAPAPIAKPSALQERTTNDQTELARLQNSGSGISQIKNPFGRNALRALETVGNIFVPRTMGEIPGTEAHNRLLIGQQRGRIGEDVAEQRAEDESAKSAAETQEAEARTRQADAAAAAAGQPKPKEEKWGEFANFTDLDGTPLIHEENSGQVVRATDKKPPTGFKAIPPKTERPDTPEQQFIDEFVKKNPNATVAQAIAAYTAATQKPEREPRQLAVTPDGKIVELRPGMTVPAGTRSLAAEEKGPTADETRRADLARNMNENLDQLEDLLTRRPDLFGPVAGRVTGLKEMIGTSDPDVAALKTIAEQMGMAMVGAHAMRNAQHVETAARAITNSFHNDPVAIKQAVKIARQSLATFQQDAGEKAGAAPKGSAGGGTPKTVKIGGQDIAVGDDGTFVYQGATYKTNPDGKGATRVDNQAH